MEETKVYIKRKADQYLAEWKADSQRKPLIVKGARQIGKTESIMHFARSNYEKICNSIVVHDIICDFIWMRQCEK